MIPEDTRFIVVPNPKPLGALLDTLNLQFFGWGCCSPNYYWRPETSRIFLIHYVENGKGVVSLNNMVCQVREGDAFLMSPQVTGWYRADGQDPFSLSYFAFSGNAAAQEAAKMVLNSEKHVCNGYGSKLYSLCRSLHEQLSAANEDVCWMSLEYLYKMLRLFIQDSQKANSEENFYVFRAKNYIRQHYTEKITVEDLAEALFLNRSHFTRVFKSETGCSPYEYLLSYRMSKAKEILAYSALPIDTVAKISGFETYSSFYRAFLSKEGCSPQEWKQSLRKP